MHKLSRLQDPAASVQKKDYPVSVRPIGTILMMLWLACVVVSFWWDISTSRMHLFEMSRTAARTAYEKDLAYRSWNLSSGPIYVPASKTPPNPYLPEKERQIVSTSGTVFTMVNASYMNRQVHEHEGKESGLNSHLTSLRPFRPENAPDPWEKKALLSFEQGVKEVAEIAPYNGVESLRLMRPILTEASCLSCHGQAGYKEGDVRGGLGVAVPLAPFLQITGAQQKKAFFQHAFLALLGLAGIGVGSFRLQRQIDRWRRSEDRFRSTFLHAGAGMATIDERGKFLQVNAALCEMLGYRAEELLKLSVFDATHPKDRAGTEEIFRDVRAGKEENSRYEKRLCRADGATLWADVSISWYRNEDGRLLGIGLYQNITDRIQAAALTREHEERLQYLAYHDALTHLPNRLFLNDRLTQALPRAYRTGGNVALLFLDLDRFKQINDSLGHEVGDRLLCHVAVRLRSLLRETDTLVRFGGDEFIILLEDFKDPAKPKCVANRILNELTEPVDLGTHRLYTSASIGISLYPGDGHDGETLIQSADLAMYCAKEKGRNNYHFCTPNMNARTRDQLLLENDLRSLDPDELILHYQPLVDLVSGEVKAVEALLRWAHPERGLVPPADFIPLAEETGLIIPIGEWVLRTACVQAKAWADQGLPPVRMAVNISARQFRQKSLAKMIETVLRQTELPAPMLELELTESMIMTDVEEAIRIMEALTRLGIRLAIDDFGAGYSSLNYLKRFPIAKLKIDRLFIHDLTENPRTAALTASIIHLARQMKMEVVAEGVETHAQRTMLMTQHCNLGQGYLFSPPLPSDAMETFLSRHLEGNKNSA